MKKTLALLLALVMVVAVACPVASAANDDYTIRIYSNSNSPERTTWLIQAAADAGFSISIDDIRTAADQSEGLLSDDCIKNLLAKYDVASDLATVTTEALEEILADYDEKFGLEYE